MKQDMKEYEEEIMIAEAVEEDFKKYQKLKLKQSNNHIKEYYNDLESDCPENHNLEFMDVDELRNKELIKRQEEIESKFKDYIIKDDTLELIIKGKIKERKLK